MTAHVDRSEGIDSGASADEADKLDSRPDANSAAKPDSPTDLTKRSWWFVVRKTVREFSEDQCVDIAAALTYYAVLAMFPAAIALLSLLGVIGQGPKSVDTVLNILSDVGASSVADTIRPTLTELSQSSGASLGLILGLVGAIWSASGYVGAFGRAMNRVYEVEEGRPIWKLRPMTLMITVVLIVLAAITVAALVVSGPVAESVGNQIGLGSTAVLVWEIAKWPVLVCVVVLMVAVLYYATPNVKQPKFRWLSPGAVLAIVVWALASVAFGLYVANFASYNATYGSLAGAIILLLWLWLTNLALMFGAELDAELERGRELQAGIEAEEKIQLPVRDRRKIDKASARHEEELRTARALRNQSDESTVE